MRRIARLEEGNPEYDDLRKYAARYRKLEKQAAEAGDRLRGEAARLVREGRKRKLRGTPAAVARVAGWVAREYPDRLADQVDDAGKKLPARKPADGAGKDTGEQ